MSNCIGCGCMEEHGDKCIIYTGPDIAAVGIKHGQRYDVVTVQLAMKLAELIEQSVDLRCLFSNTCNQCSPLVSIPEAVQVVIDKICTLTADDIGYTGQIYCLGNNSISADAVNLLGRGYQYYVEPAEVGTMIGYDLTSALENMPAGYNVSKIDVTVSGKLKNGRTVIGSSSNPTTAFRVDNDRFPVTADIKVRLDSPNGSLDMSHTLVIPTATSQSAGQPFTIKDYAQSPSVLTQSTFNTLVAAQVCDTKTAVEQLRNMQIVGCDKIKYPNTDVKAIVAVHASELCDILERLDAVETVSYRECSDECGDSITEVTLQEALKRQGDIICDLQQKLKELSEKVVFLQGQIQACCDGNLAALQSGGGLYSSQLPGGSSGGGTNGGGTCPGGICI